MKPIVIFVSYRRANHDWVDAKGDYQLIPWLREQFAREQVEFWTDHALDEHIGKPFEKALKQKINEADIALLLITPEFAVSPFILEKELPWIKERFDKKKIEIIPLLIDEVTNVGKQHIDWIFQLQIINKGEKTILERYEESRASYSKIRNSIADTILKKISAIRTNSLPPSTSLPPPLNTKNQAKISIVTKGRISKGDLLLKYDDVENFHGGLAAVKLDGKWGYVDETGNEVIPPK
ncbi:MAG: WG repeat-containing protein, partial [Puniceicoccales bacterium]|nr:WG repeat-containing protein [Puniceicoccales bacterium]